MSVGTFEQIIESRGAEPHLLIEMLLDIQAACGYIPEEAMHLLATRLGLPVMAVYRAAAFYKALSLTPRGRHLITVCMGTACHVRGAPRMLDEVLGQLKVKPGETTEDGLFTVECVNCLGACAIGPVVVLDGVYHHRMTPAKLRKLVQSKRNAFQERTANA